MRRALSALFVLASAALLCAPVRSESAPPKRIVSMMPSNTEILYALGAQDSLVGVTRFCDVPPEAKKKEKIGDFIHPNFEKIVALKPDLVLAGEWQTSPIAARLRKAGVRVEEIELPATVDGILDSILHIARITGREKEGGALVESLRGRIEKVAAEGRARKRKPTVYIEVDPPNWTVASKSFINDAVRLCGARNIFADLPVSGAQVSWEAVVRADPDVILLFSTTREEILRRPGWSQLSAVKNGRIIDRIPQGSLNRPTPSIVEGMEKLSSQLSEMGYR